MPIKVGEAQRIIEKTPEFKPRLDTAVAVLADDIVDFLARRGTAKREEAGNLAAAIDELRADLSQPGKWKERSVAQI